MRPRPPTSTLFPSTTLYRSHRAPGNDDVVIETENLTKRYGDVVAVDGLNLTLSAGEVFGLLGPNGSGKTTTILMILDRKSTRLNSSHSQISYAVFCLKKKKR